MNVSQVTRLEIIDHYPCSACLGVGLIGATDNPKIICSDCSGSGRPGRTQLFWDANKKIELSLQDNQRTLKIFIKDRNEEN